MVIRTESSFSVILYILSCPLVTQSHCTLLFHFQEKKRLGKLICPNFTRLIRGRFELQSVDSGFIFKLPVVKTPNTKDPKIFHRGGHHFLTLCVYLKSSSCTMLQYNRDVCLPNPCVSKLLLAIITAC